MLNLADEQGGGDACVELVGKLWHILLSKFFDIN